MTALFPITTQSLEGGRARVGVDKMKTFWIPPPLRSLPPRGGEVFARMGLIHYGLPNRSVKLFVDKPGIAQIFYPFSFNNARNGDQIGTMRNAKGLLPGKFAAAQNGLKFSLFQGF